MYSLLLGIAPSFFFAFKAALNLVFAPELLALMQDSNHAPLYFPGVRRSQIEQTDSAHIELPALLTAVGTSTAVCQLDPADNIARQPGPAYSFVRDIIGWPFCRLCHVCNPPHRQALAQHCMTCYLSRQAGQYERVVRIASRLLASW